MKFDFKTAIKAIEERTLSLQEKGLDADAIKALTNVLPKDLLALNLSMNPIGNKGVEYLVKKLPKTKIITLSLQHCNVDINGVELLAAQLSKTKIKKLNLSLNDLTTEQMGPLVSKLCKELKELMLVGSLSKSNGKISLDLEQLNMDDLILSENELDNKTEFEINIKDTKLDSLDLSFNFNKNNQLIINASNAEIVRLNLSNNLLSDTLVDGLAVQLLPLHIHHLNLKHNMLSFDAIKALAKNFSKMQLITLDLSENHLSTEAISLLCMYLPNTTIEFLILEENRLCAQGETVTLCFRNSNVKKLSLCDNKIGSKGGALTIDLENSVLKALKLSSNAIGEKNSILSLHLTKSHLELLDLSNNKIGVATIKELGLTLKNSVLKKLKCTRTKLDHEAFLLLIESLRGTMVHSLIISENYIKTLGPIHIDLAGTFIRELDLSDNSLGEKHKLTFNFRGSAVEHLSIHANALNKDSVFALGQALKKSSVKTLQISCADVEEMGALAMALQQTPLQALAIKARDLNPKALVILLTNLKRTQISELIFNIQYVTNAVIGALTANLENITTLRISGPYFNEDNLDTLFSGVKNTPIKTLGIDRETCEHYQKRIARYLKGSRIQSLSGLEDDYPLLKQALQKNSKVKHQSKKHLGASCFGQLFSSKEKKPPISKASIVNHSFTVK